MKTHIVVDRGGARACRSHSFRMPVNLISKASDICSSVRGWRLSHPSPVRLPELVSTERTCHAEIGANPASEDHAAAGSSDSRSALDQSGSHSHRMASAAAEPTCGRAS
eukprot:8293904-Pyramimonas_sp.AAC.1